MDALNDLWDNFRDLVPGKPEGATIWDKALQFVTTIINFLKGIFGVFEKK